MKRRILLLEPNYRNKYPPMGLMKLAMYHRLQGDDVTFYKGDLNSFVLNQISEQTIYNLMAHDSEVNWLQYTPQVKEFIRTGRIEPDSDFEKVSQRNFIWSWLNYGRQEYRNKSYLSTVSWDRVCVTTLFTFEWDITIETIKFAQQIGKEVLVGGILASVIPEKVEKETGIKPHVGSLLVKNLGNDKPLDTAIDNLPLDYSILEEIDYSYPAKEAYYSYATRGCSNKCEFCAVPILEPGEMTYSEITPRIRETQKLFGEQRNLLLMDNNVFASKKFGEIINEICESGFAKNATYIKPNFLEIAIRQLYKSWNDRAYIRMSVRLLHEWSEKLEGDQYNNVYGLLLNNGLLHDYTATKENILKVYEIIKHVYENSVSKRPVRRYVDFNQGMDARIADQSNMSKLAQISIRPLRIAFDTWKERKHYVKAVKLAKENDIVQMSNYLLYNYKDDPIDLYRRLLLNVDLCDKEQALGVNIYSFPMKYHPILDEKWFSNRDFIGPKWTRKSIRTVQSILNSTRGKISRNRFFFFKAFGRNEEEFNELMHMPEAFIIKRLDAEIIGWTEDWRKVFLSLSCDERTYVDRVISSNVFKDESIKKQSPAIQKVLSFYRLKHSDIPTVSEKQKKLHIEAFEETCPKDISSECRKLLLEV